MSDLYFHPVFYGRQDVTIESSGSSGQFPIHIYYPSDDGAVWTAPIRPGTYPLVIFAHGNRGQSDGMCPEDVSQDHRQWTAVLHLLARCGFVVASPALHDIHAGSPAEASTRIVETVRWMRNEWEGRIWLHVPLVHTDPLAIRSREQVVAELETCERLESQPGTFAPWSSGSAAPFFLGAPTSLAFIGHSWGARACALASQESGMNVRGIGSIAGTWDHNDSIQAVIGANLPTVFITGTEDTMPMSYMNGLYSQLPEPTHHCALLGLDHWDWFASSGGLRPCDPNAPQPTCPGGWHLASELVLGFLVKHLRNRSFHPPYLLASTRDRPPVDHWFFDPPRCALAVRWRDPDSSSSQGPEGEVSVGNWDGSSPW